MYITFIPSRHWLFAQIWLAVVISKNQECKNFLQIPKIDLLSYRFFVILFEHLVQPWASFHDDGEFFSQGFFRSFVWTQNRRHLHIQPGTHFPWSRDHSPGFPSNNFLATVVWATPISLCSGADAQPSPFYFINQQFSIIFHLREYKIYTNGREKICRVASTLLAQRYATLSLSFICIGEFT